MKYSFLVFLIISKNTFPCIVGPLQLKVSDEYGFIYKEISSEFCESCYEISITAPLFYKDHKFKFGIFEVLHNGQIVSKSIHSSINEVGMPEFFGYVGSEAGFTYSVSFLYGEDRCKAYEFTATNKGKKLAGQGLQP